MGSTFKEKGLILVKWFLPQALIFALFLGVAHTAVAGFSLWGGNTRTQSFFMLAGLVAFIIAIIYFPVVAFKRIPSTFKYRGLWVIFGYLLVVIFLGAWGLLANSQGKQFDEFNKSIYNPSQNDESILINFPE